jgi:hypothetical protein
MGFVQPSEAALLIAATIASWLPARRAASVNVSLLLKNE